MVIKQGGKSLDILRIARVPAKGRDPIFATPVSWLVPCGYIPQLEVENHGYYEGERVHVNWKKGHCYWSTHYWEERGLVCYEVWHVYCSMIGDDISNGPLERGTMFKLMKMNTKTLD
jgi:hypothetical protein